MLKIIVIVSACLLCISCATIEPKIDELQKVSNPSYFVIEKTVYDIVEKGLIGIDTLEGLKQGTYVAIGETPDGVYYSGKYCHLFMQERRIRAIYDGGVLMPHKGSNKKPSLFVVIPDYSDKVYGLIPKMRAEEDAGKLSLIPSPLNDYSAKYINIIDGVPEDAAQCIEIPFIEGWTN
jgi:hypothetical protein